MLKKIYSRMRELAFLDKITPGIRIKLSFFTGLFVSLVLVAATSLHYFHQTRILEEGISGKIEPSLRYINSVVTEFENLKNNLILIEDMKTRIKEKREELRRYKRVVYRKDDSLINRLRNLGRKMGMSVRFDYVPRSIDTAYSVYLSGKELKDLETIARMSLKYRTGEPVRDNDFEKILDSARYCAKLKKQSDGIDDEIRELNRKISDLEESSDKDGRMSNADADIKKTRAFVARLEKRYRGSKKRIRTALARLQFRLKPFYEHPLQKLEELGIHGENVRILASDIDGNITYDTGSFLKEHRVRFAPLLNSSVYREDTAKFFGNSEESAELRNSFKDYPVGNGSFAVERRAIYRNPATWERIGIIRDESSRSAYPWVKFMEADYEICSGIREVVADLTKRVDELKNGRIAPSADATYRNLYGRYRTLLHKREKAFSELNPYRDYLPELKENYAREMAGIKKSLKEIRDEIKKIESVSETDLEKDEDRKIELDSLRSRSEEYVKQLADLGKEFARSLEELGDSRELKASDAFANLRDAALYDFMQITYGNDRVSYMNYLRSSKERERARARWKAVRNWIMSGESETALPLTVPGMRGVKVLDNGVLAYGRSEVERYMWTLDGTPLASETGIFGYGLGQESLIAFLLRDIVTGYNTVLIDKSDGLKQIARNTRVLFLYSSLIAVISVIFTYFFAGFMVKRLRGITLQADRARHGDLNVIFPQKGRDEIETLGASLNSMMTGLREREEMKSELSAAGELQKRLLPETLPENLKGYYSISSYYMAMQGVGGDYYDFIELDGTRVLFCVGDVSNHGVGPALVMSMLRAHLRGIVNRGEFDVKTILLELNSMIFYDTPHHIFVTFFLGIADRKTNSITFSSAGHLRPVVYRYGKSDIEVIEAGGLPLGMDDNDFFSETITVASLTLRPGDVFFQYTDGLTEAMNREREQFGEERLYEMIRINGRKKLDILTNMIARAVSEFAGLDQSGSEAVKPGDDMAMIAIKRMK